MKKIIFIIVISFIKQPAAAQHWLPVADYFGIMVTSMCANSNYLYASQEFSNGDSTLIYKWNGSAWDSVGSNCTIWNTKLIIYNDTLISVKCNGGLISKFDGTNWQTFSQSVVGIVGMDVYDNTLYVTGYFDTINGTPCHQIAKWDGNSWSDIDTTTWLYLGAPGCAAIYNGELYFGGNMSNYNNSLSRLVKWNGSYWSSVGNMSFGGIAWINCMAVYKGELYIGGELNNVLPGGTGHGIMRWNGTRWDDMQGGIGNGQSQVFAMQVYNNDLYVVGNFSNAGGLPASSIAKWDGSKWCSLGGYTDNGILTIAVYDSAIYVGGSFTLIGGDSAKYVAKWIGGTYVDSCTAPNGINEYELLLSEFYFYPNPSSSTITINYPLNSSPYCLIISDALGREVKTEMLPAKTTRKELDIAKLATGVYSVMVQTNEGRVTRKLVKE